MILIPTDLFFPFTCDLTHTHTHTIMCVCVCVKSCISKRKVTFHLGSRRSDPEAHAKRDGTEDGGKEEDDLKRRHYSVTSSTPSSRKMSR